MNNKLTLRLDKNLIAQAKLFAKKHEKTLSQMVAEYFVSLQMKPINHTLGPISRKLQGALKGEKVDISEYKKHLEKKYL